MNYRTKLFGSVVSFQDIHWIFHESTNHDCLQMKGVNAICLIFRWNQFFQCVILYSYQICVFDNLLLQALISSVNHSSISPLNEQESSCLAYECMDWLSSWILCKFQREMKEGKMFSTGIFSVREKKQIKKRWSFWRTRLSSFHWIFLNKSLFASLHSILHSVGLIASRKHQPFCWTTSFVPSSFVQV